MAIYFLLCVSLIIVSQAMRSENKCNSLYYGEMDKKMMNTQNYKTKLVMDNLYKRRSKQCRG